jgi:hypothetical protein
VVLLGHAAGFELLTEEGIDKVKVVVAHQYVFLSTAAQVGFDFIPQVVLGDEL